MLLQHIYNIYTTKCRFYNFYATKLNNPDLRLGCYFYSCMYAFFFKRVIDLVVSFFALVVLWPVLLLLTILLFFANGGKAFFFQMRPGRSERIFKLVKFKTMNDKKDANGNLLPDFQRMTALGGFVRKTSLDELPQLVNVLKGDMSLVGPRPLLVEYLQHYSEKQKRRHDVRPGITGWAQVNGRNTISWEQKFELDVWYVEHLSLRLDCLIVWKSVRKIFTASDVNASKEQTMEKFSG